MTEQKHKERGGMSIAYLQGNLSNTSKDTLNARDTKGVDDVLRQPEGHHLWLLQRKSLSVRNSAVSSMLLTESDNASVPGLTECCSSPAARLQLVRSRAWHCKLEIKTKSTYEHDSLELQS